MTAVPIPGERCAVLARITGLVQGVGFRPFVHRLARRHGLAGWVRNASGSVEVWLEGPEPALDGFLAGLRPEAPVLARIAGIEVERRPPQPVAGFRILESQVDAGARLPVSPDVATCAACEAELFDPRDRRFHYPFITCTDCGPRFTVIDAMPYDRARTSMRAFAMCAECGREYETAGERRYHSETNSCPACGPRLWLEDPRRPDARPVTGDAVLEAAAALLRRGDILAIRGLGGFHLAVDATNGMAVDRLRRRKARDAKPFAVMVRTLAQAGRLGGVGAVEARLLTGPERPVVLLARRWDAPLARGVAPGLGTVGVMLAYTPVHHLLLERMGLPLVMTSGNRTDEPIAISNDEAWERLGGVADAFLLHDREIVARYDDSVVRVARGRPVFLRRARGYAPLPVPLPIASPVPLLAVGGHLKNTFTLVHGADAYVSQHIGDLGSLESVAHFRASLEAFRRLFAIEPAVAVRDTHPGYLSTRLAEELGFGVPIAVQHHHAHIGAVLAEHGRTDRVVGLAFDGTGFGADGAIWGAEALVADLVGFRRVGQLRYAPLPGGDLAARQPWRAALGYRSLDAGAERAMELAFHGVGPRELAAATGQMARGINSPRASSMGRLFDAAAAVLGVRRIASHEGQAAMELEGLAGARVADPLPFPVRPTAEGWMLDPLPLLVALGEGARAGREVADLAARFHESVAASAAELARLAAEREGLRTVALGGGCFQNARLLASLAGRLEAMGLEVLVPERLSPNDGGLSYGQAAVAAARLARGADRSPASAP
ncbi:MAG TPA: carbamoyltransferase HypF [Gemmatimonadales bacterium]|nr:carbamoyltransferase HypF [Gemmatimonadales bacterium]